MDSQEFPQNEASTQEFPQVDKVNDFTLDALTESSFGSEPNSQKIDWEKRYKDTQASYTKLQQKIGQIESAFGQPEEQAPKLSEEQRAAAETLRGLGFADMDSVQNIVKGSLRDMNRETDLREVIISNPELSPYTKAIRKLSEIEPDVPIETIILNNGFMEESKLRAANGQSRIVGSSTPTEEKPSISSMSDEDYRNYLKSNTKLNIVRRR